LRASFDEDIEVTLSQHSIEQTMTGIFLFKRKEQRFNSIALTIGTHGYIRYNFLISTSGESYIPADEHDAKRHRQLLEQYGVSNAKAYMSQFYPQIKREIIARKQKSIF
jgi:hypothetical protein